MLDADGEHQCTAPSVLCHLTGAVGVAFHERDKSCRGQGGVVDRRTFRTDLAHVMSYAAAPFHQLHLLLVDAHDGTVGIGIAVQSDDETVGQRGYLVMVADTCHRTACRDDIAEMVQKVEYLLCGQRILVFMLDAGNLVGDAPMHLLG